MCSAKARLEKVLVHRREDAHVVLGTNRGRHDSMVVVDYLLEVTNRERGAPQFLHLLPFLLVPRLPRLEDLVIANKLLLEEKEVRNAL